MTFNGVFAEVGEGHCPLLDLTQVPQPHGLNPCDLAGGTGTKQLLFCQTPLDKCSTFNNKLCKPNAKQFLASKLGFLFFKKRGKVQVISVLLGKPKIKTNKLHLATCYLNQSQLQFRSRFVKCGSGSDSAGAGVGVGWEVGKEPGRDRVRRPFRVQMPPASTG